MHACPWGLHGEDVNHTHLSHSGEPLVYCLNAPTVAGAAGAPALGALDPDLICP